MEAKFSSADGTTYTDDKSHEQRLDVVVPNDSDSNLIELLDFKQSISNKAAETELCNDVEGDKVVRRKVFTCRRSYIFAIIAFSLLVVVAAVVAIVLTTLPTKDPSVFGIIIPTSDPSTPISTPAAIGSEPKCDIPPPPIKHGSLILEICKEGRDKNSSSILLCSVLCEAGMVPTRQALCRPRSATSDAWEWEWVIPSCVPLVKDLSDVVEVDPGGAVLLSDVLTMWSVRGDVHSKAITTPLRHPFRSEEIIAYDVWEPDDELYAIIATGSGTLSGLLAHGRPSSPCSVCRERAEEAGTLCATYHLMSAGGDVCCRNSSGAVVAHVASTEVIFTWLLLCIPYSHMQIRRANGAETSVRLDVTLLDEEFMEELGNDWDQYAKALNLSTAWQLTCDHSVDTWMHKVALLSCVYAFVVWAQGLLMNQVIELPVPNGAVVEVIPTLHSDANITSEREELLANLLSLNSSSLELAVVKGSPDRVRLQTPNTWSYENHLLEVGFFPFHVRISKEGLCLMMAFALVNESTANDKTDGERKLHTMGGSSSSKWDSCLGGACRKNLAGQDLFPTYTQFKFNSRHNMEWRGNPLMNEKASVGCGPVAWASLLGYLSRTFYHCPAHPEYHSVYGPGGPAPPCQRKELITEKWEEDLEDWMVDLHNLLESFTVGDNSATWPWKMHGDRIQRQVQEWTRRSCTNANVSLSRNHLNLQHEVATDILGGIFGLGVGYLVGKIMQDHFRTARIVTMSDHLKEAIMEGRPSIALVAWVDMGKKSSFNYRVGLGDLHYVVVTGVQELQTPQIVCTWGVCAWWEYSKYSYLFNYQMGWGFPPHGLDGAEYEAASPFEWVSPLARPVFYYLTPVISTDDNISSKDPHTDCKDPRNGCYPQGEDRCNIGGTCVFHPREYEALEVGKLGGRENKCWYLDTEDYLNTYTGVTQCNCLHEWTGAFCEVDVNECESLGKNACFEHGQCLNRIWGYDCNCSLGWVGERCENMYDWCSLEEPCIRGECHNMNHVHGGYECDCPPDWEGTNCERECTRGWKGEDCVVDVNECLQEGICGHGTCTNSPGSFHCGCETGWQGQTCTIDLDECAATPDLCNNGACHNMPVPYMYECKCDLGWKGIHCNIPYIQTPKVLGFRMSSKFNPPRVKGDEHFWQHADFDTWFRMSIDNHGSLWAEFRFRGKEGEGFGRDHTEIDGTLNRLVHNPANRCEVKRFRFVGSSTWHTSTYAHDDYYTTRDKYKPINDLFGSVVAAGVNGDKKCKLKVETGIGTSDPWGNGAAGTYCQVYLRDIEVEEWC